MRNNKETEHVKPRAVPAIDDFLQLGGSPTVVCLRTHNECNQNANQAVITAATKKTARLGIQFPTAVNSHPSGRKPRSKRGRARLGLHSNAISALTTRTNKRAGMTGMATAFGMPKRRMSIPAAAPYRA